MTQPDRPDRAAVEQSRTDRVAQQLRQAAASYEPDSERIRQLVSSRLNAPGDAEVLDRTPSHGVPGRTVLWPVLGSAAAAAIIFAVVSAGGPGGPVPDVGATVTVGTGGPSASAPNTPSGPPVLGSATSTSVSGLPSGAVSSRSAGSPSTRTGTSGGTSAGRPVTTTTASPPAGTVPATGGGATGAVTTTSGTLGDRQFTATVQPVASGRSVSVGGSGDQWMVASDPTTQPHSVIGGLQGVSFQAMGQGLLAERSPFHLQWQNGTPTASGMSDTWLTIRGSANGSNRLRVPIRFRTDPTTIVLYLGTVGGGGRIDVSGGGSTAAVNLPACAGTCAYMVTMTANGTAAKASSTGDLTLDLYTADPRAQAALAAVSLR